LKKFNYLKAQ